MKRVFKTRKNSNEKKKKGKNICWIMPPRAAPIFSLKGGGGSPPSPFPREAGRESLSTSDEGVGSDHGGWSSLLLYVYIYCFRFL
jgi:hypothetical protein